MRPRAVHDGGDLGGFRLFVSAALFAFRAAFFAARAFAEEVHDAAMGLNTTFDVADLAFGIGPIVGGVVGGAGVARRDDERATGRPCRLQPSLRIVSDDFANEAHFAAQRIARNPRIGANAIGVAADVAARPAIAAPYEPVEDFADHRMTSIAASMIQMRPVAMMIRTNVIATVSRPDRLPMHYAYA